MIQPKKPSSPQETMDVKNTELERLIGVYEKERNPENLNLLVNEIRKCRVLVPANLNEKKQPIPCFLKAGDGKNYLPVYTQKEQIPKEPKSPAVLNMPYLAVNQILCREGVNAAGIAINPFSSNLIFKEELVKRIDEVEKMRANGESTKKVKMTGNEYVAFERELFEKRFMPKRFFEDGQAFINGLCEKKETFIDELYEESYQNKRMYPFLEEEFSVMPMGVSEEFDIVRVDMPTQMLLVGNAVRIYFTWNAKKEAGRYFMIVVTADKEIKHLHEIDKDGQIIKHGVSPVEGAELQAIIDLASEQKMS